MDFDSFWNKTVEFLKNEISNAPDNQFIINNWRINEENIPEKFPVIEANEDEIVCLSIFASKKIAIVKDDMEALYDIWDDYINSEIGWMDIIDSVPRPAYCVSIMKVLKESIG